jgi:hypothetical protein
MKRTSKTLVVLAAFAGFAAAASAAPSVVLSSDRDIANIGDTITLTARVSVDAGDSDINVFGVVNYQNTLVTPVPGSTQQFGLPAGAGGPWNLGVLTACTTVNCRLFSQTNAGGAMPAVSNFLIGQIQFTWTGPIGFATFNWVSTPLAQRLDFFGLTSAPGIQVTIVPEPTTAAMLGLGLFGLALTSRRR